MFSFAASPRRAARQYHHRSAISESGKQRRLFQPKETKSVSVGSLRRQHRAGLRYLHLGRLATAGEPRLFAPALEIPHRDTCVSCPTYRSLNQSPTRSISCWYRHVARPRRDRMGRRADALMPGSDGARPTMAARLRAAPDKISLPFFVRFATPRSISVEIEWSLDPCAGAFSDGKPVPTSPENALVSRLHVWPGRAITLAPRVCGDDMA